MYRRDDPRLRRTLNQISQNLESANETAQESLFTFTQNYINPCFSSIGECWQGCFGTCFPSREERVRRSRRNHFDFYEQEDYEDDFFGVRNYGTTNVQPSRDRREPYNNRKMAQPNGRRRNGIRAQQGSDPTIIPSGSYFGYLSKMPWASGKALRYKPSAADLVEHPGALHGDERNGPEAEPLIEEDEEEDEARTHKRSRSGTHSSGHTTDSLSSRGDIFPSEDELEDAVPLDDEFAMVLERRTTGLSTDEPSSGKKKPSGSRLSMRTESSRSTRESRRRNRGNSNSATEGIPPIPSLSDLKAEEDKVAQEEEADVERRRAVAQKVAAERGFTADITQPTTTHSTSQHGSQQVDQEAEVKLTVQFDSDIAPAADGYPFPAYDARKNNAVDALDATRSSEATLAPALKESSASETSQASPSQPFIPARLPHFQDGAPP